MCVSAKLLQLSVTLCNPEVYGLPGSSVHGILQARILEWNPWPPPGDLSHTGIQPTFSPPRLKNIYVCVYIHTHTYNSRESTKKKKKIAG